MNDFLEKINFPYDEVRKEQDKFIKKVYETINLKKNILVSAPTGSGKTISALLPAINIAKKKNVSVICLTSRQTQANQIIKTIRDISKKSNEEINYVAFIGKRSMCIHQDKDLYPAVDFNDFCQKMRQTGKCKFYKNSQNSDYENKIKSLIAQSSKEFMTVENFVNFVSIPTYINSTMVSGFCPYELTGKKAFQADIIVCDYNYLFSAGIRENFFGKIGRKLEECILIIDEAHNLPDRVRNSNSYSMTNELIKNATKEIKDFVKTKDFDHYILNLRITLNDIYNDKLLGEKNEYLISKKEFIDSYLAKFTEDKDKNLTLKEIIDKLEDIEAIVKEERVISFIGRIAVFLRNWNEANEEYFLRVLEKNIKQDKTILSLKIKCIDSSLITSDIVNNTYSTLLMSATLSPINMYENILGVENCEKLELESPFSKKKQLTLVINDVTTKYSQRGPVMFNKIAQNIENILNLMEDKNGIIFFPSYDLMDKIMSCLNLLKLNRKILKERRFMSKDEKEKFVDDFKNNYTGKSIVLFAITSGSFAEGLDLPDKALELVVVVGLALSMPDLFTNAVIRHFDKKFHKGQLYGYIYPTMNKIIQAAGRCIRTETDKGVVILMDNRFAWPLYAQMFPKSWNLEISKNIVNEINNFYK